MPLFLAAGDAVSWSVLLNAAIPIFLIGLGYLLGFLSKVIADRISHKRLYDHRLRLEKEYALYSDLWDKLFELRRSVGQLVEPLSTTAYVNHAEHVLEAFNAYRVTVRRGEPFMRDEVYRPAWEIATLTGTIIDNTDEQKSIEEKKRATSMTALDGDKLADQQFSLYKKNRDAFKKIEPLFKQVMKAIRERISP